MRFRSDDDIGEPLAFELGDEWGDSGSEVTFGGSSGDGGPSRRLLVVGAVAALAMVIGGALVLGRGDDESAAPATSIAGASTTGAPAPSTTAARPRRSTTTTVFVPYAPPPAFATDPGWAVYLYSMAGGAISVVDLTTGTFERADLPTYGSAQPGPAEFAGVVVRGPDGPAQLGYDRAGGPAAAVDDGTAWFVVDDGTLVRRRPGTAEDLERVTVPTTQGALGTTEDGRPAVMLGDLRMYRVEVDGTLRRVTDSFTYQIDNGQYVAEECTESGVCARRLHGRAGELVIRSAPGPYGSAVAFSPAGTHAVVNDQDYTTGVGRVAIYDLVAGVEVWSEEGQLSRLSGGSGDSRWSPDGRYVISIVDGWLVAVEVTTGERFTFETEQRFTNYGLAGVA